ncbi:MAG: heavy metal translocating P-type ATPase, partial [Peptococcaceae bacterium]|nr:heavy metal translocating P-type ATPase [Peptococcaceae bacterium]
MHYEITCDLPGRIRVRYGRDVFTEEQGRVLEENFFSLPGVVGAQAGFRTGSLLVLYDGDQREALLEELSAPDFSAGPVSTALGVNLARMDSDFYGQLFGMVAWRVVKRLFLPAPVRRALSLLKARRLWKRSLVALCQGKLNVDVLDGAAVGAAMIQSDFNTASSIMFLLALSELLEQHTLKKTRVILFDSLRLHADTVWIEEDGVERLIPASELTVGARVVVRVGSAIPVDGLVLGGEAVINESAMTGEPLGVFKKQGDSVFAGTVLEDGRLTVEVRALESDTRLHRIVDMIGQSETHRAIVQGKAEQLADKIVPYSFLLAAGVFAVTRNVTRALSVLLVDYSCAIKLATPISVLSAMREASEHGIVVKGGKFLEAVAEADTFVFDKTGTLTLAEPRVAAVHPLNGFEPDEVLRLAACMEEHFPHSVARSIVRYAQEKNLRHEEEHADVKYIAAHGIATEIHGRRAVIGSRHFVFEDESVTLEKDAASLLDAETGSLICLAVDGVFAGYITINDPPRSEAAGVIAELRTLGVKQIIMLTGDSEAAAREACKALGIDTYRAQILPADKATVIDELRAEGRKVVMVGDGINDAPALARADASVAMRGASDLARDVADITLTRAELDQLVTLRRLSQALM